MSTTLTVSACRSLIHVLILQRGFILEVFFVGLESTRDGTGIVGALGSLATHDLVLITKNLLTYRGIHG